MNCDRFKMLVINPGSTSTKIALYENETQMWEKTIHHSSMELERFGKTWDQYDFRKQTILKELENRKFNMSELSSVVGRGGLLPPMESGTYRVNNNMINDLRAAVRGEHASNLGPILAYGIAWDLKIEAFTVDPVSVDELEPLARYSGIPEIPRESILHALNIKAVARKYAKMTEKPLDSMNIIVTHMGGGITACALRKGRMIDVNNGIQEGPFTPERAGSLPTYPLIEMCFSGKYTKSQIKEKLVGKGGLVAYLGTNSAKTVEEMIIAGNQKAREVYEAMAYQISKEIGQRATVLKGEVDGIVLTGGIAYSKMLTDWITDRVKFIAPVTIIPGENEMEALALGALRVLRGEENAKRYGGGKKTVGVVYWESMPEYEAVIEEFENALKEAGFRFRSNDENLEIIYKNCDKEDSNLRSIIKDFLDLRVDMIYSIGSPVLTTVKKMLIGKNIPVVCAETFDPVVMGLIKNYNSNEDNVFGTYYKVSLSEQFEKGLFPITGEIKKIGILHSTEEMHSEIQLDEAKEYAKPRKITIFPFSAKDDADIPRALEFFNENKVEAVFITADTTISQLSRKVLSCVLNKFPTLCALKSTVIKGGLVAYCADWKSLCEKSADIAVSILSGEKPHGASFIGPKECQLIINVGTAKSLGIEISDNVKKKAAELIT